MLPIAIAAGTTPSAFFLELLPAAHERLAAPATTPFRGRWHARIAGGDPEDFTLDFDGPKLTARVGTPESLGGAGAMWATRQSSEDFDALIAEIARLGPAKGGTPKPVDGALERRLATIRGVFRVVITDLAAAEGARPCRLELAIGPAGKAMSMLEDAVDDDAPDVTIEVPVALLRVAAAGGAPPGGPRISGKKHLAMALGLAFLPLLPAPPAGR